MKAPEKAMMCVGLIVGLLALVGFCCLSAWVGTWFGGNPVAWGYWSALPGIVIVWEGLSFVRRFAEKQAVETRRTESQEAA